MNSRLFAATAALALVAATGFARAEGELNIYNWGNYTNPDVIKKFEEKYKVKVTITDYDSNDTALAKVRQGGTGFDIAIPSQTFIPIWIKEKLFQNLQRQQRKVHSQICLNNNMSLNLSLHKDY